MENQLKELSDSLKSVLDLTSRIDERLKYLVESNIEVKDKVQKLTDSQIATVERLTVLENKPYSTDLNLLKTNLEIIDKQVDILSVRVSALESSVQSHATKWSTAIDFIFKVCVAIISAIILWKMGIKP